ncbi:DEAD/DEAH box helicase [Bacterioplanoides pacificum]|uniref:ATP-dependent RNA helicase RhlE n=1 Tax=Bacterioplanoides pacificum TaxID=1171596 RepID=A0ABV7VTB8_9GAMM
MSFANLGLSPELLQAIEEQGYQTPSPIQQQAIPAVLSGKDVMAAAQTGTGKTAGFTLPILQKLSDGERARANQVRALIVTPTRELAAQVGDNVRAYSEHLPLTSAVVFGGVKINPQMLRMRRGADILVATPGRLLDLYSQNAVRFKQLEVLVLDEADRMLDMGFIHDIKKILKILPEQRQNLLFSATFSDEIKTLAKSLTNNPLEISVTPANSTAKKVEQVMHPVDKKQKPRLLKYLIQENNWQQVLVFCRTKHGANRLTKYLEENNIRAAAIHGNKSQGARTRALSEFKSGEIQALIATDIAARGIDIDQLPQVVNFDLPNVAEDYVHRIGRTGRAGASGHAVSLVAADEIKELSQIENLLGKHLERDYIPGYEPVHEVPQSTLRSKPKKSKKPKKPKAPGHQDGQKSVSKHHQRAANSGDGKKAPWQKKSATNRKTDGATAKPPRRPQKRTPAS